MRYLPGFRFNDFFDDDFFTPSASTSTTMQCDIKETDTQYEMNIALPGYKKEDITIDLDRGYLKVSANVNKETEEKDDEGRMIRTERYHGSCSRSFYVGDKLTEDDINARFDNGELIITFPKETPERITNRTITIE